jgi:hypothetical protein
MSRTTTGMVISALGPDYRAGASLVRPIKLASLITDRIVQCASRKNKSHTSEQLLELETQLAAHYYTRTDRLYRSRATDRASGSFLYNPDTPEPYLANAVELDHTGCVRAVLQNKTVSVDWLGKDDPEKLTYDERN